MVVIVVGIKMLGVGVGVGVGVGRGLRMGVGMGKGGFWLVLAVDVVAGGADKVAAGRAVVADVVIFGTAAAYPATHFLVSLETGCLKRGGLMRVGLRMM